MENQCEIKVVTSSDSNDFENKVNQLIKYGFRLSSSSCGFINSESYNFCDSYHAILVK